MITSAFRVCYICPRGFSNEVAYWLVRKDDEAEVQAIIDSYDASPDGHAGWIEPTPRLHRGAAIEWEDRQYARQCQAPYTP